QLTGGRLYRTGDLARYLPDGCIEFQGRVDHQVKVRGYRIELGEIEALLSSHPAVKDAVVIGKKLSQGESQLIAYLVFHVGQYLSLTELRSFVREKLPDYMVPSFFVALDALPLTPNLKVDRNALPDHQAQRVQNKETYSHPSTETEKMLVVLWQE